MLFETLRNKFSRSLLPHVGIYTLFGVLWITLSDRILLSLIPNREILSQVQTYKGWFFIFITSVLLYFLMDRNRKSLLREKREQEEILESVPLPLLIVDNKDKVVMTNPAFTETFGYEQSDIPDSKTWFRKAYPDETYRKEVIEEWTRTQTQPQEALHPSYVFTVTDKDGRERITEFILLNRVGSSLLILRDLTGERRRLSESIQEDKMRALGQLAGGIAHDFNNQLCAIMGFTDLLCARLEGEPESEAYLKSIIEASATAAELTEELLAFSRKTSIEFAKVDIEALLQEIIHIGERTFPASVQIRTDFATEKTEIPGNRSQINSMLLNLLLNARDAMPGGGEICISLSDSWLDAGTMNGLPLERGIYLVITVTDQGSGIAPENLSHIFEPFFTTKDKHRGSGMGLAMVYSSLQYHKGGITVKSDRGKGTSVQLFFPTNLTVPE